jgi:hypothetical protein
MPTKQERRDQRQAETPRNQNPIDEAILRQKGYPGQGFALPLPKVHHHSRRKKRPKGVKPAENHAD